MPHDGAVNLSLVLGFQLRPPRLQVLPDLRVCRGGGRIVSLTPRPSLWLTLACFLAELLCVKASLFCACATSKKSACFSFLLLLAGVLLAAGWSLRGAGASSGQLSSFCWPPSLSACCFIHHGWHSLRCCACACSTAWRRGRCSYAFYAWRCLPQP